MTTAFDPRVIRFRNDQGAVVGAGFLLTGDRILTCAHVVREATRCGDTPTKPAGDVAFDQPLVKGEPPGKARVVWWDPDPQSDLAVLEPTKMRNHAVVVGYGRAAIRFDGRRQQIFQLTQGIMQTARVDDLLIMSMCRGKWAKLSSFCSYF